MVKYTGILIFVFAWLGLQTIVSAASTAIPPANPSPGIANCLKSHLDTIKDEFLATYTKDPKDAICGSQIITKFTENITKVIQEIENCSGISCYLTALMDVRSKVLPNGIECASKFAHDGPVPFILNKIRNTIVECVF